ncbi:Hypothetical predicted protein [Mytilus galloprovincialis]|uniref:CCHC-type domain-containing protein n=1 Tax=Mytilus galloprovincialis TaxID=29158 RepID=A0A8B6CG23_MYTGA|nr:Hypothetical predicted protein [Mytilus galloprovincialis]
MEETINLVAWHTTCKNGKNQIRQIEVETEDRDVNYSTTEELDVRRIGGKRFVTEERLNQFGRDIKDSITTEVTKSIESIMDAKLNTQQAPKNFNYHKQNQRNFDPRSKWQNKDRFQTQKQNNNRCYNCQEEGHFARYCPKPRQNQGQNQDKEEDLN